MKELKGWQNRFYKRILERGLEYYQEDCVRSLSEDEKAIYARVGADRIYDVKIDVSNDGHILAMFCSCPYARDGNNCKHEAAALFAYENGDAVQEKNKKKASYKLLPFGNSSDKADRYFDLGRITASYRFPEEKYDKAAELYENGAYKVIRSGLCYPEGGDSQAIAAELQFREKGRDFETSVFLSRSSIHYHRCGCPRCMAELYKPSRFYNYIRGYKDEELCEHEITALMVLRDVIERYDPGDNTDRFSMDFLDRFTDDDLFAGKEEDVSEDVSLMPKLELDHQSVLRVCFRVGSEKMYIVKDLDQLVEKYEDRSVFPLGVRTSLDFGRQDFTASAKGYFEFIREIVRDERSRSEIMKGSFDSGGTFTTGKDIILYGKRLDQFYELAKDEIIELNDRYSHDRRNIVLSEAEPRSILTVSEERSADGFEGVHVRGDMPGMMMGLDHAYFLKGDTLYRSDPSYMKLYKAMKGSLRGQKIDLHIGKKELGRFYHRVLPKLKESFDVYENNKELYEKYIPPLPEYSFYFDVNDGIIFLKAKVLYGSKEYILYYPEHDPVRDLDHEKKVLDLISTIFYDRNEEGDFFVEGGDDIIYEILEELVPKLMKIGDVHSTPSFDRLKVKRKTSLSVGVRIDNGLLELDVKSDDIPLDELAAIVGSYRQKKKYHKLKNGDLVRTDDENLETLDLLLSSMNIPLKDFVEGKMHIPEYRALYLDKLLEGNEAIYDHRDAYFRKLIKDLKTIRESEYEIPESLNETMRPYQKTGFKWLKTLSSFRFGGILADEMGLGKTLQVMAVFLDQKMNGGGTSLVVCPSSLIYNWLAEIRRFTPQLNAAAVVGTQNERAKIISSYGDHDVLVTSYDLLKRDIASYEGISFVYEILDEAQYIKTYTTANAKACKAIQAKHRFALTGTPIENNLSELWSIFDYLMPGFLYSYEKFRDLYEMKITRDEDEKTMTQLKSMIAPFILRRKKADVLTDLPDKIEETIRVRMEDKQRKLYDSQVLKISKTIQDGSDAAYDRNRIAILAELMKVRQVCCEPSLVYEDYDGESAKRLVCIEVVKNAIAEGHKILLFSQFTSMLEIIEKELGREGIRYYKITGQTKKEERLKLVEAFNEDDVPLFLISLKAGGTGLNLTGADIVIHYDPWWNVAAQNQATDRAHRIGQKNIVTVYKIIAEDTIEEKILDLQERKMKLADDVLDNETVSLFSLSREELLSLLK